MTVEIRLAHLSDWHATTLVGGGRALLQPKRMSGWASWRFSRRARHSVAILEAAIRDVRAQQVDRILVSGDLTHVSLEAEFVAAARQLESLGSAERVFLIPGNHDCYVPVEPERSWDHWSSYLLGTPRGELPREIASLVEPAACAPDDGSAAPAPLNPDYPTLRLHDRLAVIGLCSAIPVPIFRARGELGARQLERLGRLLSVLGAHGYARVVMLHHPVVATDESPRRRLADADALRAVLAREGADLVLHGHKHRRRVHFVDGPDRPIPVVGVPSSSEVGSRPDKRAQYHLYRLVRGAGESSYSVEPEIRGFDARTGAFGPVAESLFGA